MGKRWLPGTWGVRVRDVEVDLTGHSRVDCDYGDPAILLVKDSLAQDELNDIPVVTFDATREPPP